MSDLDKITARFGRAYNNNVIAKKRLDRRQKEMFDAFTTVLEHRPLGRRSVPHEHWEKLNDKEQQEWIRKHHPGHRLVDYHSGHLILEEDPAYIKFAHINKETGKVYARTVAQGSPGLDDEALRADNPELWERITEWPDPWYSLVRDVIIQHTSLPIRRSVLESRVGRILEERGVLRVLKPFHQLSDSDLMEMEDYFLPGPLTIRVVTPRDAKSEELEHVQEEA